MRRSRESRSLRPARKLRALIRPHSHSRRQLAGDGLLVLRDLHRGQGWRATQSRSQTVLNKECSVAGTPVLIEDGSLESIECIIIGADERSWADSVAAHESHDEFPATGPGDWRVYQFSMNDEQDNPVSVALLRPADWLGEARDPLQSDQRLNERDRVDHRPAGSDRALIGATVQLELSEFGLGGPARVVGVEPCPPRVTVARGGFVSGTIARHADATLRIHVDATHDVIDTTASPPFWSATRGGWTPAGDLTVDEILTWHWGTTQVTLIDLGPPNAVYNIEVFDDHTYFVGQVQAWVHNACILGRPAGGKVILRTIRPNIAGTWLGKDEQPKRPWRRASLALEQYTWRR